MMDIVAETADFDLPTVTRLQQLKTGALIEYSVEAACIMTKLPNEGRTPYRGYARNIGLAFQIADDLIDHSGDEAAAGKPTGRDADAGKATFVSLQPIASKLVKEIARYGGSIDKFVTPAVAEDVRRHLNHS